MINLDPELIQAIHEISKSQFADLAETGDVERPLDNISMEMFSEFVAAVRENLSDNEFFSEYVRVLDLMYERNQKEGNEFPTVHQPSAFAISSLCAGLAAQK